MHRLSSRVRTELKLCLYSPRAQRLVLAALALAVTWASQPAHAYAQGPGGDMKAGLMSLVKDVVDFMILVGGGILAMGIGGNFIAGQIAVSAGSPGALSHTWLRVAGIIIAFIGLFATIPVTNIIIDKIGLVIPDQTLKPAR